jgi:hypothetical protein
MKNVLTPEPIDRERARKDIAYFAEKYLDIVLTETQVKFVDSILKGQQSKDIYMIRPYQKQQVIDVSIAIATNRGIPIIVKSKDDYIDGETV